MLKKEVDFLKEIVLKVNDMSNKSFNVSKYQGAENDLITNLDLEIEKFLISEIKKEYPSFDIVSEEYNTNNHITDNCFIIDPIDGTINFANNLPLWGIQIACVKNGKTIASVISLPRINELYRADETGAYLNDKIIKVNEVPIKNTLYAIDGNNNLPCMQRMRKYSSNRRNFGGFCVSMAFMACGRIHGAVFRSDKPWDYEPGLFLCKMAGAGEELEPNFYFEGDYTKRFFNQEDVNKYFGIIGSLDYFETSMMRNEEEYSKPKVLYQIKVKKDFIRIGEKD